jgi:hypothetical protein
MFKKFEIIAVPLYTVINPLRTAGLPDSVFITYETRSAINTLAGKMICI